VALNGLGLLWMLATGAGMLVQKWRRPAALSRKAEPIGVQPVQPEAES